MINGVYKLHDGFGIVRGNINGKCDGAVFKSGNAHWPFNLLKVEHKVVWVAPLSAFIWNDDADPS